MKKVVFARCWDRLRSVDFANTLSAAEVKRRLDDENRLYINEYDERIQR